MNYHKRVLGLKSFLVLGFLISLFLFLSSFSFATAGIKETNKASDFTLYDIEGNKIILSDFYDKEVVLLDFFASWCPSCIKGIPEVNKINKEYKDRGFVVLGINIKESEKKVASLIKKHKISYRILLDKNGRVSNNYNVRGIPYLVLISKKGNVVWTGHWLDKKAKAKIKDLLKE